MPRRTKRKTTRRSKEAPVPSHLMFDFGEESDATEYTIEEDSLLPKKYNDSNYDMSEYSELRHSSVYSAIRASKAIRNPALNKYDIKEYEKRLDKRSQNQAFKKYYIISLLALLFTLACVIYWMYMEKTFKGFGIPTSK
ncbi:unnamed protein product [Moneuplotes crassus]|uniref:Uncharacterized protein n=1 Tax=Euplotes crassus TaxID=5936 RepID=A0AAD2D620_EUPCR|nr:unnamed protein product [Moneuplotes crassus]